MNTGLRELDANRVHGCRIKSGMTVRALRTLCASASLREQNPSLPERPVDRGGRFGEPAGARLGHVEAVFEADSELAGDVDSGLVGEAHAGGELGRLAVDEVDRLVPLHADAVAGAVGGAGELVARAVAPGLVLAADRVVDRACGRADAGGGEGDVLA